MVLKILLLSPLTLLVTVILFRALFLYKPSQITQPCSSLKGHQRIKLNTEILDRFKGALDIPTISYSHGNYETGELIKLIAFIESSFPHLHNAPFVKRELVSNYTLLYTIEGSNEKLRPYMLTSHMDVVPVVREKWSSDPFKSVVKEDNNLYARGTIDAKHLLMSMLEAFEVMLKDGFKPLRSFYFVFGHDEEISGIEGAQSVSKLLEHRMRLSSWDKLEYILDEGNVISKTRFPGIEADIGLIGVVEKGYLTVKVSVNGSVGHGSMPPPMTAIAKLSSAISKFHSNLLPSFLGRGVEREMIEIFAEHSSWPMKLIYANFWLFKPIFNFIFSSDPALNSLVRTSTAVTLIEGGTKENVLPDSAVAYINHRLHPLHSIADVLEYDRKVIDDPVIQVEATGQSREPSPISNYCDNCYGYQLVKQSLLQVYPGTVVVPSTFLAASDSRWYSKLSDSIYKFSAIAVQLEETKLFHGHDERISLENYENLINFYHHLIQNSDAVKLNFKPKQREDL